MTSEAPYLESRTRRRRVPAIMKARDAAERSDAMLHPREAADWPANFQRVFRSRLSERAEVRFVRSPGTVELLDFERGQVPTQPALAGCIRLIRERLRSVMALPPSQAIAEAESIWQQLDELVALAESQTRILIRKLPKEPSAARLSEPHGFKEQLDELGQEVLPTAARAAAELAGRLTAGHRGAPLRFVLEPGPNGAVQVRIADRVTWTVNPPRLPFPGISVRAYFPSPSDPMTLDAQSFYFAPSLLKRTAAILNQ